MSPSSSSGITSFSFSTLANQTTSHNSTHGPDPASQSPQLSALLRCAGTAKTSCASLVPPPNHMLTLPTVLLDLVKTWLIDKDSLPLILTGRRMHNEVQGLYRPRLRDEVAKRTASPIASSQNTINLKPSLVFLGAQGERVYQKFQSLKASGMSDQKYGSFVVSFLVNLLSKVQGYKYEVNGLRENFAAASLALGGSAMTAAHRNALLSIILNAHQTCSYEHMGAMIKGLCAALGPTMSNNGHHRAVYEQILTSHRTSTPIQMGSMIGALCTVLGGRNMPQRIRTQITAAILASHLKCTAQQMRAMLYYLGLALGGRNMKPGHRDDVLQQVLDFYESHRRLPLDATMQALCAGFIATDLVLKGRDMKREDLDVILSQILSRSHSWSHREMGIAIAELCWSLEHRQMSGEHRDTVLAKILASSNSLSPAQMGAMMTNVCAALGGKTAGNSTNEITQENLNAMISQILASHGSSSQAQRAAMIYGLFQALGATRLTAKHRAVLVAQIKKSALLPDIVAALNLTPDGVALVDFLQLERD